MTVRLIRLAAVAVSLCAALASAACTRQPPERGRTLIVARAGDMVSLDPAVTVGAGDGTVLDLCYDQLTAIDPTSTDGAAIGRLARSWTVSPDGLTWRFQLQPGRRFASGNPVTAADVVASFERVAQVGRAPAQGLFWLKSASAPDPVNVVFTLNMPFPALPKLLALPSGSVLDTKAVAAHAVGGDLGRGWLATHCAGSGAYDVQSWLRGQRLTLVANPNSPVKPAYFDKVVFKIVPDAASRRVQMRRGDVDLVDGVGAAEAEHYAAMPGVAIETSRASNALSFLTLNVTRGPLTDVRVRRAVAEAIDYPAIRDKVLRGNAILLSGLIPPGVPGYDPSRPQPARDLAGAKALLAASGHPTGVDLTLVVGEPGPVAELIQANLADAGIRVRLKRMSPAAIDATRASRDFDMIYDGWVMDFPDPFIFLNLAFASPAAGGVGNFSGYSSPAVDQLLLAAMVEADPARRADLYRQAQGQILAGQPVIMLFSPRPVMARRASLTGVRLNPYQPNYLNVTAMGRD